MRKKGAFALCIMLLFLNVSQAFGDCSWSSKVVLSDTTSDVPGLTAFNVSGTNKLFLAYVGTDSNRTINVEQSTDGQHFNNKVVLSSMRSSYGVGITGSPSGVCNALYLGFPGRDPSTTMNASKSTDGINWSGPVQLFPGAQSAPAFDSSLKPVLFGYNSFSTGGVAATRTFDCNIGSLTVDNTNFFPPATKASGVVGPPALYGEVTSGVHHIIRGVAFGPNNGFEYEKDDNGLVFSDSANWSDSGLVGLVNASNPTNGRYLAWKGGEGSGNINIKNYDNGAQDVCSDTTVSTPALAFFNGKLWVAWRSSTNNTINVASLSPF